MIDWNVKKRLREESSSTEEPLSKRYRVALKESHQEFISCFQEGVEHAHYVGADKAQALLIIAGYLEKESLKKVMESAIRDPAKGNTPVIVDYVSKTENNGFSLETADVIFTIKLAAKGPQTPLFRYLREREQRLNPSPEDGLLDAFEERLRHLKL